MLDIKVMIIITDLILIKPIGWMNIWMAKANQFRKRKTKASKKSKSTQLNRALFEYDTHFQ
ncbi:MAG: hypothetical protein KAR79_05870, partial [Simkaniaceae bacterium]|nr:hypothetical protein [Simkaniaceae bacterium]